MLYLLLSWWPCGDLCTLCPSPGLDELKTLQKNYGKLQQDVLQFQKNQTNLERKFSYDLWVCLGLKHAVPLRRPISAWERGANLMIATKLHFLYSFFLGGGVLLRPKPRLYIWSSLFLLQEPSYEGSREDSTGLSSSHPLKIMRFMYLFYWGPLKKFQGNIYSANLDQHFSLTVRCCSCLVMIESTSRRIRKPSAGDRSCPLS